MAAMNPALSHLSAKNLRLVRLLSLGMKNSEIATELGTTEHVVKNYLRVIYDQTGMWNRTELALWFIKHTEMEEK